jgi:choline kinase
VVLGAGQGLRLRPLTDDRPKCLVEIAGQPILDHQLDIFRQTGVTEVHVVAGYCAEKVVRPGVQLHINPRYATTNMVTTLFAAESAMRDDADLIISYGDIVYETRVLHELLRNPAPVALAIDRSWRRYWEARMANPLTDAETLKLGEGDRIIELGKKPRDYADIQGQYMGLIKVRADHVAKLAPAWRAIDRKRVFDGGKDYDNMYMTSFLQHLIDTGWDVRAALVDNGWMEIDAIEDTLVLDKGFWHPGR